MNTIKQSPVSWRSRFTLRAVVVTAVIAALAVLAGYSQYELHQRDDPAYEQKLVEARSQSAVNAVGKLMELPSGTPQFATVADSSKLAGQAFFAHALNGDEVLIYPVEAILYRPSTGKIINVLTDSEASPPAPPAASAP